ncbi:MAG: ATP-binding cassette domain-containing protein [Clostridia bacterium]|nr:ATP-binding cassette domain-containing protein [Clostridia bacterium]
MSFFGRLKNSNGGAQLAENVIISARGVSLSYEGKTVASDLNFEVCDGDYLCVVGENGSGKSTLLKAIIGLKGVNSGELFVSDKARRAGLGYLPQTTPGESDFPASVREIVLSGCLNRIGNKPFFGKAERAAADDIMARLDILQLADKPFSQLSGGQCQRVLLARAYCAAGAAILLDEPVSGLDPEATQEMYRLISELNREDGKTVVMVSHDTDTALKYASKILYVGGTAGDNFFGTTEEYISVKNSLD